MEHNNNLIFVKPEQLVIARKLIGMNQREFSSLVNLSTSSYNGIETGKVDPKLSTFNNILKAFLEKGIIFYEDGNVILKR